MGSVIMCIHSHQPVDNFGYIFEVAYTKAYKPFLDVLEKHPNIKFSIHYSGAVLDWVMANKRDFLSRIKKMIHSGQIELLTGGYYEPILSIIPERDAIGQINMLTDVIKKDFDYEPRGIWITERVWSPSLINVFSRLDLRYTVLDDFHLKACGKSGDELFGRYLIKGIGDFSVFASIKRLRYIIPFSKEPEEVIRYLETVFSRTDECVVFADDGEKFGLWPYTYKWVYKRGWLDRFFALLEKSTLIETKTFSQVIGEVGPKGTVDLPHSSYAEMMEWSGGNFENFFKKYPESDWMRRRMIMVSKKIEEQREAKDETIKEKIKLAQVELYKAQSGCGYWHGVFGGIYMRNLRHGVFTHLIRAEKQIENTDGVDCKVISLQSSPFLENSSFKKVVYLSNKYLALFIVPESGEIVEIDYKPKSYNLVNSISRREEVYHKLVKNSTSRLNMDELKKKIEQDLPIDLYKILGLKNRGLSKFLIYDSYQKNSFKHYVISRNTTIKDFVNSSHVKENNIQRPISTYNIERIDRDCVKFDFQEEKDFFLDEEIFRFRIKKFLLLRNTPGFSVRILYENMRGNTAKLLFGLEFNWSIEDRSFMQRKKIKGLDKQNLKLSDRFTGIEVKFHFRKRVDLWSFPMYTVNETESGLAKSFQGVSFLFYSPVMTSRKNRCSVLEGSFEFSHE